MNISNQIFMILTLIPLWVSGQIAIHSDVYSGKEGTLGIYSNNTNFVSGSILTDDTQPGITYFASETDWEGANHSAHVEGYVWITDHNDFNFPVGHTGIFQPMAIHNSPNSSIAGRFVHEGPPEAPFENEVGRMSREYFWEVIGDTSVQLSFGWTSLSNLEVFINDIEDLVRLGHSGERWEIIPAQINVNLFGDSTASTLESSAITAIDRVDLNRYNRFTFGSRIKDMRIQVSEAFTHNGDGINDTWLIRNIDLYPNANFRVYNRWGSLIYEARGGYQNNWNGHFAKKRNPLPSAPYFYQIDLEFDGEVDIEGWLYINY